MRYLPRVPSHDRRLELFDQMLALFPPGRLVDLGAGHGMFSVRAHAAGWTVTAVDGRVERFPAEREGIEWVQRDIRDVDLSRFDVVACLGLFYHLTVEDQVKLLGRITVPLVLDTHVANGSHEHTLTEVRTSVVDGQEYHGAWYQEPGKLTSSVGNPTSFWPTPESLAVMLERSGFSVVLEATPWVKGDRTFWLCLPEGYRLQRPAPRPVPVARRLVRRLPMSLRRPLWRAHHRLTSR